MTGIRPQDAIARFRQLTPSQAAVAPIVALHLLAWCALGVATVQRLHQYVPSIWGPLVIRSAAITILVTTIALAAAWFARGRRPFDRLAGTAFTPYMLALSGGILLAVVPLFLLLWRTKLDDTPDWSQEFVNKRWLPATFLLVIGTLLVLPSVMQKLLSSDVVADSVAEEERRSVRRRIFAVVVALALGVFLAGPPWYIGARVGPVDFHEQGHLGPIQGIWNGYLPYIGPASTMYGPGSQLTIFEVMKRSGHFDIVGFREGFATLHFIAVLWVAAFAAWTVPLPWVVVILGIGLYWSPLGFFRFDSEGIFAGFWGWANTMRYVGALIVAPLAGAIALKQQSRLQTLLAFVLGAVWGFTAWMSQENLAAVPVSTSMLLVLMWVTDTSDGRTVARIAGALLAGAACVWLPIVGYYALHGEAFAFLRNYLAIPLAVSAGFQNSWWTQTPNSAFRFSVIFLVTFGVLTLCDVRTFRLRRRLTFAQVRLLAFVLVLTACYQTALHRADDTHLINTMLALPFVIVLGVRDIPRWSALSWGGRAIARVALAALVLAIYPLMPLVLHPYVAVVQPALNRLVTPEPIRSGAVAAAEAASPPDANRRIPPFLANAPSAALGSVSMPDFLDVIAKLKTLVGDRKTYVEFVPTVLTGLVYFAADLKQGPYTYDKETMLLNRYMYRDWFDYFRAHADEFECVITQAVTSTEGNIFLNAFPNARIVPQQIGAHTFYVLLR